MLIQLTAWKFVLLAGSFAIYLRHWRASWGAKVPIISNSNVEQVRHLHCGTPPASRYSALLQHTSRLKTETGLHENRRYESCTPPALCNHSNGAATLVQQFPQFPVHQPKIQFLVLTHNPTEAQFSRILRYARQLETLAKLTILVDHTKPYTDPRLKWQSLLSSMQVQVDFYDFYEDAALVRYPEFQSFWKHRSSIAKERYSPVAAWFTPVAILDWFHTVRPSSVDYIWVITDDVGFSGDIATLVNWYNRDTSDLIQGSTEKVVHNDTWPLYRFQSQPFLDTIWSRSSPMRFRLDNIQRWNMRILFTVLRYMDEGIIGSGETWLPTLAALDGLRVTGIDPGFIGYKYQWDTRVESSEWLEIRKSGASKLFHALKF